MLILLWQKAEKSRASVRRDDHVDTRPRFRYAVGDTAGRLDMRQSLGVCVYVNTFIAVTLSLYLFVAPAAIIIRDLDDPGLRGGPIPRCALRWHSGRG